MIDFPAIDPTVQSIIDALRLDGDSVEPLFQLNPAAPQLLAFYNGGVFFIRVPTLDPGEVAGLEISQAEGDWDAGWQGGVIQSGDPDAIVATILATPAPTAPDPGPTPPSGFYAAPALTFETGSSTSPVPGVFSIDAAAARGYFGSTSFSSQELWFRWNSDATSPSGTTRQIGVLVHRQDASNALEVQWTWAPSNTGITVKRLVSGSYSNETPTSSSTPVSPADGKWHRLRVDVIGTALTVRCDGVIVWQGTLSVTAQGITGPSGLRVDNLKADCVLYTPPVPVTNTIIQVDLSPQASRPSQMIEATQYPVGGGPNPQTFSGNVTYERMVANTKTDRVTMPGFISGFTAMPFKFAPQPGDLYNNGNRAGLRSTGQDVARRKCHIAYMGDRTRDTFKIRFPTAGMTTTDDYTKATGVWGVAWQYHQEGTNGISPPIAINFRRHYASGLYWVWLGLLADYYNQSTINQPYPSFMAADGTWPLGGEVKWNELMQLDHTYTFIIDIYHSQIGTGGVQVNVSPPPVTPTMQPGALTLTVDGVVKVNNLAIQTGYDAFNFPDATLYQARNCASNRYLYVGDWLHEHIPGPNNPLYPYYVAP